MTIRAALEVRLGECGLELHPDKTRIVYCKDGKRRRKYPNTKFEFLGYDFRARGAKKRSSGELFTSFLPAVSKRALKSMRQATRARNFRNRTDMNLSDISHEYNSVLSGWWRYYGRFYPTAMQPVFYHFNKTLVEWAMRKYRRLKGHKERASLFLQGISKRQPRLFTHWTITGVPIWPGAPPRENSTGRLSEATERPRRTESGNLRLSRLCDTVETQSERRVARDNPNPRKEPETSQKGFGKGTTRGAGGKNPGTHQLLWSERQ